MNSDVTSQWVNIGAEGSRTYEAYLALPPAGTGLGLVLFQEIFGVNDHIQAIAEQYALDGFVVLAPDIFWRQSNRISLGYGPEDIKTGGGMAMAITPDELDSDIATAVTALRNRPEVAGHKVAAIGYCFGGRLAFLAAANGLVDASVAYYGGGIQNQLSKAEGIDCPCLFHYAGHDDHIPPQAVNDVRAAVEGKEATVHVYPDARHGFNCWARPSHHAPSSVLARGRTLQFLADKLYGQAA